MSIQRTRKLKARLAVKMNGHGLIVITNIDPSDAAQAGVRIISYSGPDVFIHNADIPRVIEALARHLRGITVTLEEAVREVERDR
ncbi:MAG TPA: hypothetical protein VFX76_08705 [Roseiflexaceae bacterium]|nr:hypothetical protein [Roseiflexaceae bacterium]